MLRKDLAFAKSEINKVEFQLARKDKVIEDIAVDIKPDYNQNTNLDNKVTKVKEVNFSSRFRPILLLH